MLISTAVSTALETSVCSYKCSESPTRLTPIKPSRCICLKVGHGSSVCFWTRSESCINTTSEFGPAGLWSRKSVRSWLARLNSFFNCLRNQSLRIEELMLIFRYFHQRSRDLAGEDPCLLLQLSQFSFMQVDTFKALVSVMTSTVQRFAQRCHQAVPKQRSRSRLLDR
jgi:hypothetical protein